MRAISIRAGDFFIYRSRTLAGTRVPLVSGIGAKFLLQRFEFFQGTFRTPVIKISNEKGTTYLMGRRDTIKVYIFLACALVCAGAPSEALVGNSPRPFSMDGLDGRSARISAAELRRPVLVHLFSTQRPDWKEELLALSRLYARIKAKGAAVVSIAGFTPQAVRELSS